LIIIFNQPDKGIHIAGLVLKQSRGIEKEEEKSWIINIMDITTTGLCSTARPITA
jgi:hypothetical protein